MVDASWDPETKAGGYGYWIASNRGKVGGGAPLDGKLDSSNLAEMQAVCNVLFIARNGGFVLPGDEVLIQTDCRAAMRGLEGSRELTVKETEVRKTYLKLNQSLYVELRHVRGHSLRMENRFCANRHCDASAYGAMQHARKLLKRS